MPVPSEAPEMPAPPAVHVAPKAVHSKPQPVVRRNYIAAHWTGDHSIGRSYWMNICVVSLVFAIAVLVSIFFLKNIGLRTLSGFLLTVIVLSPMLVVWQLAGLVRSILRRQPDPQMRVSVIWGWIGAALLAIGTCVSIPKTLLPMSGELIQILQGDPHMTPLQVRVLPGGDAVEIAGGLQTGSAKRVLDVLKATPNAKVLHIESLGGRIREALEIARFVQDRGMTTYVSDSCMSAATLIFAAGSKRYIEPKAKLGFHAGTFPGLSATILDEAQLESQAFMREAGIDSAFIEKAYSTPNATIWTPTVSELESANVITAVARPGQFMMSSALVDAMSPEKLDSSLMEMPIYRALRKYDPKGYQKILEVVSATAAGGESLAAAIVASRKVLMPIYNMAIPRASDDALIKMVPFIQALCQSYGKSHPTILRAMLESKPLNGQINELLPDYPVQTELEIMTEVFETASAKTPTVNEGEIEEDSLVILQAMEKLSAGSLEKFSKLDELNDREYVAIMGLSFRCMNEELPSHRLAQFLRYSMSQ